MAHHTADHALLIADIIPVHTNAFTLWALLRAPLSTVLLSLCEKSALDIVLPVPHTIRLNVLGKTLTAIYAMLEGLCSGNKVQVTIIPIHARNNADDRFDSPECVLHLPTIGTILESGASWTQLYVVDAAEARHWRDRLYTELRALSFGGFLPIYQHVSILVMPGLLLPDEGSLTLHRQPSYQEDIDLRLHHADLRVFNHAVKAMVTTALIHAVTHTHSGIQLTFEHVRCDQIIGHLKDVRAFILRLRFAQHDLSSMWLMAYSKQAGTLASKLTGSDYGALTVVLVPHDESSIDMLA